jgi:TRAP-type mannitol/chloroaromatic compound transport system permease small subunit
VTQDINFLINTLLNGIDTFTEMTGRCLAWLSLVMLLAICTVVALRYGFEIGSVGLQESVTYFHASIFMLGGAYALKKGAHVRVDIFYRNFSARGQAWVNSLGGIVFLLPLCGYILLISADFVAQSWQVWEVSTEPGGIPAVFLLKTLIPAMAINLALQAIAEILRNTMTLMDPDQ